MSKELPPSRVAEQFVVRFPEGMRSRIADAAKANNRSMNAEIVARLEASFGSKQITSMSAHDVEKLLATDENAKAIFSEQLYNASTKMLRDDASIRAGAIELFTAALLLREDQMRGHSVSDSNLDKEEAIAIVKSASKMKRTAKNSESSS